MWVFRFARRDRFCSHSLKAAVRILSLIDQLIQAAQYPGGVESDTEDRNEELAVYGIHAAGLKTDDDCRAWGARSTCG